ncbi:hypothetical protein BGZ90_004921 [Linnemannia elongata]|nr:hypothetical protein BGZ90_004921 [Linnemannia elongata]
MDDSKGAWPRILKSHDDPETNNGNDRAWILNLFKKHGYHVRHLSVQWRVIVDAVYLGQTCIQLRSLTTNNFAISYTTKEMLEYEHIQEEGELTYEERMEPAATGDLLSLDFVGDVFRPMAVGWRTLEQQERDWYTSQYFWMLIRENPGLTSLELGWNMRELFDMSPEYVYTALAALPQLTFLDSRLDSVELDRVLKSCPRLQTYRSYRTSGFRCFVGHEWPSLQTLELDMLVDTQERDPIPNVFRYLMEACFDLRVLDGVHHKIDVEDLESHEWVCSDIEKLRCQFVGISRLAVSEEAILETPEGEIMNEELKERRRLGREQQQTVYDRLSTFTRLRVLDFGYEFRELSLLRTTRSSRDFLQWHPSFGQPIAGTMELSLASGLGCLGTLKDLEVFGFEGVDHRIGKPELEWMAINWPKLKVMRGLQEDDVPGERYRAEKAALREYMQMLRPNVKHEAGPKSSRL